MPLDVGVEQRLAPGDGDHRRAALLDRADHVLHRQPLAEDVGRVLDLAAPRAGEVAGEQRLDLHDEGVVLGPLQLLPQQVGADLGCSVASGMGISAPALVERNWTVSSVVRCSATSTGPRAASASMTPWTSDSGAEAPGGEPDGAWRRAATGAGDRTRPRSSSARHPCRRATSTSRAVFDELAEPTTSIRSQSPASARTASWRFWVA